MRSNFAAILLASVVATGSHDAQAAKKETVPAYPCMETLKGKLITLTPFAELVSASPVVSPKDEFETTTEYEARKSAAVANGPNGLKFVELQDSPKHPNWLRYDADQARFMVNPRDFGGSFSSSAGYALFGVLDYRQRLVGVTVHSETKATGSYEASNGYGAKTTVLKADITRYVLIEGFQPFGYEEFTLWRGGSIDDVGYLSVPSEMAREIKGRLRVAIMFEPKPPYFVSNTSADSTPTRSNPIDETEITKAIVGDMKCAVLYDAADNSVQWAIPTR